MGIYVNPGNSAFAEIADSDYVDKTGLIGIINESVGKRNKLTCVSRPRRFGKSWAARMLTAYYDCSCDSHALFEDKKIAETEQYETHLNRYNVICLDITGFTSEIKSRCGSLREVPELIKKALWRDLLKCVPEPAEDETLNEFLLRFVEASEGRKIVFIIDEWDAVIREAKHDLAAQEAYLNLLRGWFKNSAFTPQAVAAAYMTGIFPIKKDGSQSAISDFKEYTILKPGKFAEYTGFTEEEVKKLCEKNNMPFEEIKA